MRLSKVTVEYCNNLEKHIIFLEKSHTYSRKYLSQSDLDFLDMCVSRYKEKIPNKIFTKKDTKRILKRLLLDVLKKKLEYYRNQLDK